MNPGNCVFSVTRWQRDQLVSQATLAGNTVGRAS